MHTTLGGRATHGPIRSASTSTTGRSARDGSVGPQPLDATAGEEAAVEVGDQRRHVDDGAVLASYARPLPAWLTHTQQSHLGPPPLGSASTLTNI